MKCCSSLLSNGWVEKRCGTKIVLLGETLLKRVSAVGFLGKQRFWKASGFTMICFCVTIFGLLRHICSVNAMIFIKLNSRNLFRSSFYKLLKILKWCTQRNKAA